MTRYSNECFYPSPSSLELVRRCASDLGPDDPTLDEWFQKYHRDHAIRIAHDLDFVARFCERDTSIVEFGSVPLLLTAPLVSLGHDVTGVDIDPSRFSSAISRIGAKVSKCDIENETLSFPDNTFDVSIFFELFEHLRINPIFTLREIYRVLKPGGVLLISTPNLRSLSGLNNFLLKNKCYSCSGDIYKEYEKLTKIGHMGHVREYTTLEVTEFLEKIGFSVEEIVFRGKYGDRFANGVVRLLPRLRPFSSFVARKGIS